MHESEESMVATPILAVSDMDVSMAFYRLLGLHVERFSEDYSIVSSAGHELLHLEANTGRGPAALYLNVLDADDWHHRSTDAGLNVSPIVNEPWDMREFAVIDDSGNTLRVGHNL